MTTPMSPRMNKEESWGLQGTAAEGNTSRHLQRVGNGGSNSDAHTSRIRKRVLQRGKAGCPSQPTTEDLETEGWESAGVILLR